MFGIFFFFFLRLISRSVTLELRVTRGAGRLEAVHGACEIDELEKERSPFTVRAHKSESSGRISGLNTFQDYLEPSMMNCRRRRKNGLTKNDVLSMPGLDLPRVTQVETRAQ